MCKWSKWCLMKEQNCKLNPRKLCNTWRTMKALSIKGALLCFIWLTETKAKTCSCSYSMSSSSAEVMIKQIMSPWNKVIARGRRSTRRRACWHSPCCSFWMTSWFRTIRRTDSSFISRITSPIIRALRSRSGMSCSGPMYLYSTTKTMRTDTC